MRRAILAVLGTAVGTTMLVGAKTDGHTDAAAPAGIDTGVGGPGQPAPSTKPRLPAGSYQVTGPVVRTRHGQVQVRIKVAGGRLVDVVVVQVPSSGRTTEINQRALPILRQEALVAQSARIDTVSGATNTSEAYRQSLQAALDAAVRGQRT